MAPTPRSAIGRADLLRMLCRLGAHDAQAAAGLAGFAMAPEATPPPPPPPPPPPSAPAFEHSAGPALQAVHFAMVARSPRAPAPADALDAPAVEAGPCFDDSVLRSPAAAPIPALALVPARRMASLVRAVLRPWRPTRQPDVQAWVDALARGRLPLRLRMCERRAWSPDAGLLIQPGALSDVWRDELGTLAAQVHRWSGGQAPVLLQTPAGAAYRWRPGTGRRLHPWHRLPGDVLPALQCTLWAGDSHVPAKPSRRLAQPAHWTALLPAGVDANPAVWPAGTRFVAWDHGQRLVPRPPPRSPGSPDSQALAVASLLCSLTLAVRVEPALLRAIRLAGGWPASIEAAVWCHDDMVPGAQAVQLQPGRVIDLRAQLLASHPVAWCQTVAGLVRQHHRHLSPLIRMEEAGLAQALAGLVPDVGQHETWATALRTRLSANTSARLVDALDAYVRRAAGRRPGELWSQLPGLAESYVLADEAAIRSGAAWPDGLPPAAVQRILARGQANEPDDLAWQVVQRGDQLWLTPGPPQSGRQAGGSLLGELGPVGPAGGVVVQVGGQSQWQALVPGQALALGRLDKAAHWVLHGARASVTVAAVDRPPWADEWGREGGIGLYALTPPLGSTQARFEMIDPAEQDLMQPFLPTRPAEVRTSGIALHKLTHWQLGIDRPHGLFADLQANGVTQRFRYLPPGDFWMGSPDHEPGRYSDESPCHPVRLTAGFWLADTTCTQALWQAVMGGKNPSHFKGDDQRPVESVSFDDVQQFLARLQPLLPPGCQAVLPTEAQWEYACRAGLSTAFNTGTQISRALANFDAAQDTPLAERGEESKSTMPVKSLPPNAWGLYEMHGNVWEWCDDDWRDYAATARPDGPLEDPTGPQEQGPEALRAVRGGSWFSPARFARSAYRLRNPRGYRLRDLGCRLALRSTSPEAPEGRQPGAVAGPEATPAARRDAEPRNLMGRVVDSLLGRKGPPGAAPPPPTRPKKPKR